MVNILLPNSNKTNRKIAKPPNKTQWNKGISVPFGGAGAPEGKRQNNQNAKDRRKSNQNNNEKDRGRGISVSLSHT